MGSGCERGALCGAAARLHPGPAGEASLGSRRSPIADAPGMGRSVRAGAPAEEPGGHHSLGPGCCWEGESPLPACLSPCGALRPRPCRPHGLGLCPHSVPLLPLWAPGSSALLAAAAVPMETGSAPRWLGRSVIPLRIRREQGMRYDATHVYRSDDLLFLLL